ncbi:MAG: STAS domain-containing protein [Cyclobacteriaceae bacterium]
MHYSIDKQEKYYLFSLEEEKLDTTIAPDLKSEFVTASAEGVANMIVDLGKVKYIDSSGLSALLVGNRVFSDNNGAFIIAAPTEHVMKLIKISQLNNVLNILPTTEEAVDAVFMHELEKDFKQDDESQED